MNGENRLLVTDEPVEFEKQLVEVQDFKKTSNLFTGIQRIYLKVIKKILKDVNMKPAGLGNSRILTDYAKNSPRTLIQGSVHRSTAWTLEVQVLIRLYPRPEQDKGANLENRSRGNSGSKAGGMNLQESGYQSLGTYDWGRTGSQLQMNWLSLRNNRLKFKTAGKLPIILEEFIEQTPIQ